MFTALLVLVILVALIVVHELGHFLAAKLFDVRVDEFGVGYPPRAFLFGAWGGTEYTLNWIPFGGFVRLYGEDENMQHGQGSLIDAPRWKQALILIAGVFMNALIAFMLFIFALHAGIPRVIPTTLPQISPCTLSSPTLCRVHLPMRRVSLRVMKSPPYLRKARRQRVHIPRSRQIV